MNIRSFPILKYDSNFIEKRDSVASEEPIQITLEGHPIAVIMRTPGEDLILTLGFLLTEGIIQSIEDIEEVDLSTSNHALVFLKDHVSLDLNQFRRNLYSASSCGICGKATIDSIHQKHSPIQDYPCTVSTSIILQLPDTLRSQQQNFKLTGGIHAAALFDLQGNILTLQEDVGRHNAVDKVIGFVMKNSINTLETILQLSGRVSFEVMQKSLALGIPIVGAISAPTDLAIRFAEQSNQTLIGFLRPPTFNLYAGRERLSTS